LRNGGHARN